MHLRKWIAAFPIATFAFWGSGSARAAQIPWKDPSGTADGVFTYDNGGTSDQLFVPAGTDPVVTPNGLTFFPSGFKAQASNGSTSASNQVSDKVSFDLHFQPQPFIHFQEFDVSELGDFTIQGAGPHTAVKVSGSLFLTNLDTGEVLSDTLHTAPSQIGTGNGITTGQGAWTGEESILNIPLGWQNLRVELDNILQASSDPGTNTFIEKKIASVPVVIAFILPEPSLAALGIFAVGLLIGGRRRAVTPLLWRNA